MSKPVKELVKKELIKRFEGVNSLAVIGFTGIDSIATHKIRGRLRKKDIHMTVVKNAVARQAFKTVGLDAATEMLDGPCAVAYGSDSVVSVVRELLDISKDSPNLTVKAALLDGEIFGSERIEQLSKYPNRQEAIGRVVGCILSAGANLAGCLIGPGGKVASIFKKIQENADEPEKSSEVEATA